MKEILIELIALIFILLFTTIFFYIILPAMKKDMKKHNWGTYFKKCGIYQGKSHWITLKKWLIIIKK